LLRAFRIAFAAFMHFFYLIRFLHGFSFYLCTPFLFCFPFLIFSKLLSSLTNHLAKLFTELRKSFLRHLVSRVDFYPNSSSSAALAASRAATVSVRSPERWDLQSTRAWFVVVYRT